MARATQADREHAVSASGSSGSPPEPAATGGHDGPNSRARARRDDGLNLRWSRRWSLGQRIMAVNLFALLMLAGGILYLDSFRDRLIDQRREQAAVEARMMADALDQTRAGGGDVAGLAARLGRTTGARLRLFDAAGRLASDSWSRTGPTYVLRDPAAEPWQKHVARFLDRVIESVGRAPKLLPFVEHRPSTRATWPEVAAAARGRVAVSIVHAPDRTPVAVAAAPLGRPGGAVLLVTDDARDITRVVRDERTTSFLIFLGVLSLSALLSFFLARTIARPLRRLAIAAQRVRLGRARDVTVPRLPRRTDEIGMLARALSDMTQALHQRMDATESFAADVAHEIKNPLASIRSAVETLGTIKDPALRAQLLDVLRDDVIRIDRLITGISDVSRLDAELSRTRFQPVDLGAMTAALVGYEERAGLPRGIHIAFARPEPGTAMVSGEEQRLAQVVGNLIDNALSFSPEGAVVCVTVSADGDRVLLRVEDDGPGIPPENREDIFNRFYSERPAGEDFGKHSGLGLAIARAVVDAHDGKISVSDRNPGMDPPGARFTVSLPAAQ